MNLSPRPRRLFLSLHVIAGVGWLGVELAIVGLSATAATTDQHGVRDAVYVAIGLLIQPLFPVLALSTLVSGVVLSVGTKWGLLTHWWIVTKLVINVVVIVFGIAVVDRFLLQAPTIAVARPLHVAAASTGLSLLAAATLLSVYKPWGRTPRGRARVKARVGAGTRAGSRPPRALERPRAAVSQTTAVR
jgi:hypothetical protein